MATIINTPAAPAESGSNGMGFLFGILILILFVVFLFIFGAPYLRRMTSSSAPQINVPDKVDVNVNTPQQ